jgi:drug/metabolite transporter (DMT)-like permease
MPPFLYGSLRVVLALGLVCLLLVAGRGLRRPPRADLPVILAVGLGQIAASVALMNLALEVVPAGRSSVLVFTMPLWVAVILAVSARVLPTRVEAIGLAAGMAGICVLLNPAAIDWTDRGQLLGAAELLASGMIWAATTIVLRRHRWRSSPMDLLPWQLIVGLVPLAALWFTLEAGEPVHWQASTILVLAYSGLLATGFAYWASQSISRALPALVTTAGFLAIPVIGLATSALMLGEPVTLLDVAGFSLTLAGVAIVSLGARAGEQAAKRPATAG